MLSSIQLGIGISRGTCIGVNLWVGEDFDDFQEDVNEIMIVFPFACATFFENSSLEAQEALTVGMREATCIAPDQLRLYLRSGLKIRVVH